VKQLVDEDSSQFKRFPQQGTIKNDSPLSQKGRSVYLGTLWRQLPAPHL
jgi:hypothetical protein